MRAPAAAVLTAAAVAVGCHDLTFPPADEFVRLDALARLSEGVEPVSFTATLQGVATDEPPSLRVDRVEAPAARDGARGWRYALPSGVEPSDGLTLELSPPAPTLGIRVALDLPSLDDLAPANPTLPAGADLVLDPEGFPGAAASPAPDEVHVAWIVRARGTGTGEYTETGEAWPEGGLRLDGAVLEALGQGLAVEVEIRVAWVWSWDDRGETTALGEWSRRIVPIRP